MPTPIIKIDVQDEKFQRLLKHFEKFQKDVKAQPEAWKSINDEAGQFADVAKIISEAVEHHRDLAGEIAGLENQRLEVLKQIGQAEDDSDKKERQRHKERAHRAQDLIDQTRTYSDTLHSTFRSMVSGGRGVIGDVLGGAGNLAGMAGKSIAESSSLGNLGLVGGSLLTGIGAIVGGAGMAAGLAAMVGSYVTGQARNAGRAGIKPGTAEGYKNNLSNYFDTEAAFGNLFQQENSPGGAAYLKATLGVDPNATPQQQLEQAAFGARNLMKLHPRNLPLVSSMTHGLFEGDFGLLGQGSDAELRGHFATANAFKGPGDDAIKKFQNLTIAVDNTSGALKNSLIDILSRGAPTLTNMVKDFGSLSTDIEAMGPTVDKLTSLLTGKTFNNIWHGLSTPHEELPGGKRGKDVSWSSIPGRMWGDFSNGAANLFNRVVGFGEHGHAGQVSPKGAMGAAQLMPGTAALMAHSLGMNVSRDQLINNPGLSLKLGHAYLGSLLKRYGGDQMLAVAAYNAGPARVDSWLHTIGDPRRGQISDAEFAAHIPFSETRNYVARVFGGQGGGSVHIHKHKHIHKNTYKGPSTATVTHTLAGG